MQDRADKSVRQRMDRWWDAHRFQVYVGGLIVLLFVVYLWPRICITVPAGHRGVMFRRFSGTVTQKIWAEGLHIVPPWDVLEIYETRVQEKRIELPVITRDGLRLVINVSVRYHPVLEELGVLHQTVGPHYFERVVEPEIEASLRRIVADRTAYDVYSTEGDVLQEALLLSVRGVLRKNVFLDELLIKRIELPDLLREAIENKHRQEQLMFEYDFVIARAAKEAERKRIEAAGIRDFQGIIAEGISEDVLRWRGIEATLELARSDNAKVIVVGGGEDGLPLILDATEGRRETRAPGGYGDRAGEPVKRPSPPSGAAPATRTMGSEKTAPLHVPGSSGAPDAPPPPATADRPGDNGPAQVDRPGPAPAE